MEKNLSLEAFNVLEHFFSGLIPEIEVEEGNGSFVWVCSYGGMNFYRRMTVAELFDKVVNLSASQN